MLPKQPKTVHKLEVNGPVLFDFIHYFGLNLFLFGNWAAFKIWFNLSALILNSRNMNILTMLDLLRDVDSAPLQIFLTLAHSRCLLLGGSTLPELFFLERLWHRILSLLQLLFEWNNLFLHARSSSKLRFEHLNMIHGVHKLLILGSYLIHLLKSFHRKAMSRNRAHKEHDHIPYENDGAYKLSQHGGEALGDESVFDSKVIYVQSLCQKEPVRNLRFKSRQIDGALPTIGLSGGEELLDESAALVWLSKQARTLGVDYTCFWETYPGGLWNLEGVQSKLMGQLRMLVGIVYSI